jgi:putative ABC transport system permease protein
LFVGAFLIFNTFSITVAQRTREFGLLRALGASGRQITLSVFLEALIVAVVASLVGILAGVGIAAGLKSLLSALGIDLPSSSLVFLPRTGIVALGVGVAVTLVAAIGPARRASKVSPMAALRESAPQTGGFSRRRTAAGSLVVLAGVSLLLAGLFAGIDEPVRLVGAGAVIVFLGVALLAPLIAGPLARSIGTPVSRLLGLPGKLARQNAARNPRRTAATAAALMIGLALVGCVAIFAASLKASTNKALDESLKADFTVSNNMQTGPPAISPEVSNELYDLPEVAAVAPIRLAEFKREDDRKFFLVATDPDALETVADIEVLEGDLDALEEGGLFLYDQAAEDLGLGVGDTFAMEFPATEIQELEVVGIFANNSLLQADYLISVRTYDAHYPERSDARLLVKLKEGVGPAEATRAMESVSDRFPNVAIENQSEAKESSARQVNQLLGLVSALLGLAILIALLGITNTLALSVFERTRELGLLRAVGMARRQTRSMIRWESVIIAIIGAVLGLALGTFFGWALVSALESEGITELSIPVGQLLIYLLVAGLAGVLAALPPARRAARLNVLEAIATE